MADKTTGGLKAAEAVSIGDLPGIIDLYDETLIPVEQQGEARHMTGRQWRNYAETGVDVYVKGAQDAAKSAAESAKSASGSAAFSANSAESAAKSALSAKQYSGKPPVIQDGSWWTWNAETQQYTDTGEAARGNLMYATFFLDPASGDLYMVADKEYAGPKFRLNGADLEVVLTYV